MKAITNFINWIIEPHPDVTKDDDRNFAKLFAGLSVLFLIIIIPANIPFYFSDIRFHGFERFLAFVLRSIVPGEFFFTITYFLAKSKNFRIAGHLFSILIPSLVLLIVVLETGPDSYLLLLFLILSAIVSTITLPFRWQVIQLSVLIIIPLILPFLFSWILLEKIISNIVFQIMIIGGATLLIGKFISHQEKTRIGTIGNLNERLTKQIADTTSVLENMGEGVVFISPENKITLMNQVVKKLLNHNGNGINSKPEELLSFYTEEKEPIPANEIFPSQGEYRLNTLLKTHDGLFIPVTLTYSVIVKDDHYFGSAMIIHDSRKEKELEETRNNFFSVVSHEIRTPVTKIRWGLDLIKPTTPIDQKEIVESMSESILRINQIIDTMFIYVSASNDNLIVKSESVDLEELLGELQDKYQPLAKEKQVDLLIEIPERHVFTNAKYLRTILDQYLNNAIKFTEHGKITLTVDKNKIVVTDTGPGIPASDQKKIFAAYYQEGGLFDRDQTKGGLGIGLSLVKLLANKSNLKVGFSSQPDKGSQFFVEIDENGNKKSI